MICKASKNNGTNKTLGTWAAGISTFPEKVLDWLSFLANKMASLARTVLKPLTNRVPFRGMY